MSKALSSSNRSFFQRESLVDFLLLFVLANVVFGFLDMVFGPFQGLNPVMRVALLLAVSIGLYRLGATRFRSANSSISVDEINIEGWNDLALEKQSFYAQLERRLRRHGNGYLMIIQANDISSIDGRYEKHVGDYFLSSLAKRLGPTVTEGDIIGRMDRILFGVFLSDRTQSEVELIAKRMCGSTLIPLADSADRARLSAFVGYTEVQSGEHVLDAMARANQALAVAQRPESGRMASATGRKIEAAG